MSGHTPRPWSHQPLIPELLREGWLVHFFGADDALVGAIQFSSSMSEDEAAADARLIAAAPDLLATLRAVIANHCPNDSVFCSTCTRARAVIAKAEGE
jgi:hypothetical protein